MDDPRIEILKRFLWTARLLELQNPGVFDPNGYVALCENILAEMDAVFWDSIETAPRDGTRIIGWIEPNPRLGHGPDDGHEAEAYWEDVMGRGVWVWHGIAGQITRWRPRRGQPKRRDEVPS